MFFSAPTLGFLLASPAFAAVLPLGSRDVLEIRQASGAGPFDGEATTFTGSPKSSCGAPLAAGAIAVALNGNWQKGTSPNLAACGKTVSITNNGNGLQGSIIAGSSKGKTITATVQDTCPECDDTHIDLTTGAWNELTDNSQPGVVSITWSFPDGAPGGSGGGGSTPTTPAPASGSGGLGDTSQTVQKNAVQQKSGTKQLDLSTTPLSGDLEPLGQTDTGSGNNTDSTTGGDGSTPSGTDKSLPATGSNSGTPSSGSSIPATGSDIPSPGTSGNGTDTGTGGGGTGQGPSGGVAGKYYQCGGSLWTGPTVCESGTTCQVQNQYYSQCL